MPSIETEFEMLKNETGEVIGFSLIAKAESNSEEFCRIFPEAFRFGKADIKIKDEVISFVIDYPACFFKGICTHKVNAAESSSLRKILKLDEGKKARRRQKGRLKIEKKSAFSPGFRITM
jgi:hypothetical protein